MSGVLTGIYMLATGASANWLAGVVAQHTTESQISGMAIASDYSIFSSSWQGEWTLACVAIIVVLAFRHPFSV